MLRLANVWDKPAVRKLFDKFHEESGYVSNTPTDRFDDVFDEAIVNEDMLLIVLEEDDEVVGFLLATMSVSPFSFDLLAAELAWYMDKNHRSGSGGYRMFRLFEEWGEAKGADHLVMACINELNDLGRFYEKNGYSKRETTYSKRL